MSDPITAAQIDAAEAAGACAAAIAWLRECPRTRDELIEHRPDWAAWGAHFAPRRYTAAHVARIVELVPWAAARYVELVPWAAARYIADRITAIGRHWR